MSLTVQGLPAKLDELGIRPIHYSIDESGGGENYVIKKVSQFWEVYFSERGERYTLRRFQDEHAACEYFLKFIQEDSVVMGDVAEKKS